MKSIYVITGATGGMGLDICRRLNPEGINVLVDLNEAKLKQLEKDITDMGRDCIAFPCDITDTGRVSDLVSLVKTLGQFKALIHTAGISESMGTPQKILEVNLIGTKRLTDAFYGIADGAVVILFASITGHLIPSSFLYNKTLLDPLSPNFLKKMKIFLRGKSKKSAAYAFSKKGVIMLAEREVDRWAKTHTRILSISPGAVETPLSQLDSQNNPAVSVFIKNTPFPRSAQPGEITDLVVYLFSEKASFITGVDYIIDGGITSYMKYHNIFK